MSNNIINRNDIVKHARSFIGAKWKHLGRHPTEMDCVGLLVLTANCLGIEHNDPLYYERSPKAANFLKRFITAGVNRANENKPRLGRIGIFRDGPYPCHCGIIGEDRKGMFTLIHAYALGRRVVEVPFSNHWQDKLVTYLEYPGVN
jgi:hypothetical protein